MTNLAVEELNRELGNPAGDLDAEMFELTNSVDLRMTQDLRTWFSALPQCCFKVRS